MASTKNTQQTITWVRPILKNQPLEIAGQDPALTTANMVLQTMFGAPFKWRFNRNTFTFPTVIGQCDYPLSIADFGFLEDQWVIDATAAGSGEKVYPMTGAFSLPYATGNPARPTQLAIHGDDGAGTLILRLKERPDKVYTIGGTYQKKAPVLLSIASRLFPLPDEFVFVFNWGFLTITSMIVNDARFPIWEKYFIGRLLGLQDGLDEVAINIFLGLWATNMKTMVRAQSGVQQGTAGRAS